MSFSGISACAFDKELLIHFGRFLDDSENYYNVEDISVLQQVLKLTVRIDEKSTDKAYNKYDPGEYDCHSCNPF